MSIVPVLEIGGTHVAAALVDSARRCVVGRSRVRDPLDADGSADSIIDVVVRCAARLDAAPGATWGVAIPGPFDYTAGIGIFEGVAKFGALRGVDLGRTLLGRLPAQSRVVFLNDAEAFVVGEWVAGAGAGHDRLVGITLGTGVGSGFLAGGRIVDSGPDVPPGGHVHRLVFEGRPLEDTVSRRAIMALYAQLAGPVDSGAPPDVSELAARARGGDPVARRAVQDPLRALGRVLEPWLERFRASGLVVGGSMAGSWDLVGPALRDGLGPLAPRIALLRARLPDEAALIGAALYACGEVDRAAVR